ncbi:TetR/AcrR family transcriptional regulator [Paenibacillus guangzhouensis]|uniref:TetR/AcrR family transcriptional regulator n=1 Tax=Paenibacillus guangzhouensis TaxID=1473112 RepID=UPI001266C913|nr:TetR/AcrR family transcriptional regulator [Paenibacillus guangzhouensis]
MRVVKEAEQRRNEILDAADALFGQKGFDGTSTNDILEKVGIARGTLYYHFKSKEDIMDALIQRYSDRILGAAQQIASDQSIPVVERVIRTILAMNLSGESSDVIMDHIHKPQNALMHQKIQKFIFNGVPPILTGIIREGIAEGMFNTPYPYECMEMVVIYANTVFDDDVVAMSNEERMTRIFALVCNIERLLGAETGSLKEAMKIFER